MLKLLVLLVFLGSVYSEKARFDNYTVYRFKPASFRQLKVLRKFQQNPNGLNFWTEPYSIGSNVDVMVAPHRKPGFLNAKRRFGVSNEVYIKNVQEHIDKENAQFQVKADFGWTSYHTLDEIYSWLDSLAAQYPVVESVVGGHSYEGREIRGVKVSYGPNKPAVFIEGGNHAREWISPATVTWMLNELLNSSEPRIRNVAEAFDWYFFPSINPDGYVYSHTVDRMWRKTRRPSEGKCVGVDINRNWNYKWKITRLNKDPCSEIYAGTSPFSEPETKSFSKFLKSISDKLKVYLAFHSYSQYILYPYGNNKPAENHADLQRIGEKAASALASRHGKTYEVGNISKFYGYVGGVSVDWVKKKLGVPVSYAFELRDTGLHGFVLPAKQIIPSGEETLDAVVNIMEDTLELLKK